MKSLAHVQNFFSHEGEERKKLGKKSTANSMEENSILEPISDPLLSEDSLKTLDDFETIIFPVVGEFLRNEGIS